MKLEGIHHITAICADAKSNVDFYTRVLGLKLVKKTVNYDMPEVYHLYYGDDVGNPGSILTFFEFPGADRGLAGAGMIYRITWRVASVSSLDFWQARLSTEGITHTRDELTLSFLDREGLGLELAVAGAADPPLPAKYPSLLPENAIRGFQGVRAYARSPDQSESVLAAMGMQRRGGGDGAGPPRYILQGDRRHATYSLEPAAQSPGVQGTGTVHHIAFACQPAEQAEWRNKMVHSGASVTQIIDRNYFKSIYFREPSGVLFEIATLGPGFAIDEPVDKLGQGLMLPSHLESMREKLEKTLTPI